MPLRVVNPSVSNGVSLCTADCLGSLLKRGDSGWITLFVVSLTLTLATATECLCSEPAAVSRAPRHDKVLFLGNSITRHGPSKAVDWSGNWGMAASAAEKDFVHLVTDALAAPKRRAPEIMVENIATFERQYATHDVEKMLEKYKDFGADLVIVAIGENVPPLKTDEAAAQFGDSLRRLLKGLKASGNPTIVVRSCFWANEAKDMVLMQVCDDVGGIFVDIGHLGKDEANYARSEREYSHKGVAAHPGDKGMKAIADAILKAVKASGR